MQNMPPTSTPANKTVNSAAQISFQRGKQAKQLGDLATAITCFRETISLQADFVPAYNNLANALHAQGQIEEALTVYQQALQLAPNMAVLYCNLASLYQIQGQQHKAIAGYQQAIALQPNFFLAHYNLGKALAAAGNFHAALSAYQTALRLQPNAVEAQIECGNLYQQHGYIQEAVNCYKTAIRIKPSAQAYNSLGAALQQWGETKISKASYYRALALEPDFDLPHFNLGQLLENIGPLDTARTHYERALTLRPDNIKALYHMNFVRQKQADWYDYGQHVDELISQTNLYLQQEHAEGLPAMIGLAFPLSMALHKQIAMQLAGFHAKSAQALSVSFPAPTNLNPARLRIGYVSPDFRCHAVGTLICTMFQYHQRPEFEIFAYSLAPIVDDWTKIIQQGCDHFVDISQQAPLTIARRIHADGIHILIDLAGYTAHSCTTLFAFQPAPVQIQYLGYPGTMGADFIQYIIADGQLIPESLTPYYRENIIRLSRAWVAAPMTIADMSLKRADYGLPEHGVVFCCFNGVYKLEPNVFGVWMRILQRVPASVLWLSDVGEAANNRLRQAAQALGIAETRLVFAPKLAHAEYLARYRLADLFLDTFIYNAGATAVGALWTGLPVLTCPGESYASRMGASLCHAVGLPELVCDSILVYEEMAVQLGNQPEQIQKLKVRLATLITTAPLFQVQAFVSELEQALREVWQQYSAQTSCA